MKRIVKIAGRTLLALGGAVLTAWLVLLIVNYSDQPPSAASIRLARPNAAQPQVREQDNGYVFMLGFGTGLGQDPQTLGAQRVAWSHQMKGKEASDIGSAYPTPDSAPQDAATAEMKALIASCKTVDRACEAALEGGSATIDAALEADRWLYERYQALLARAAFQETSAYDLRLPFPRFAPVLNGQRLLFLQAWTHAGKGDAPAIRALLERDGRFWRMTLASSNTLIVKMIASAALIKNFEWGSLIMRRLPAHAVAAAVPGHWSEPISAPERSMLRALAGEYAYLEHATQSLDREALSGLYPRLGETGAAFVADAVLPALFQRQDYLNRCAAMLSALGDTFEVPYHAFPAALERAHTLTQQVKAQAFDRPLYNVPGNLMLAASDFHIISYPGRLSDMEGLRRAALLTADLRSASVEQAQVRLRLVDAALRNPYDGAPFWWDGTTSSIVFVGVEASPRGRHALPY